MKFQQYQLRASRGDRIEVTLSKQANALLLDSSGLAAFKSGRSYRHHGGGGWVTRSPHQFEVPRDGTWYVVIFLPGGGAPRSSARVLPGRLPAARLVRPASPLTSIVTSASAYSSAMDPPTAESAPKSWDVFISHASADKVDVVLPLATALIQRGVTVWLDAGELRIGDSLRRKIDQGIRDSRFGVVVLSPSFFDAPWPEAELDGLVTRETGGGGQIILPIWHDVTREQVGAKSPLLASRLARSTRTHSIDEIADEIAGVVGVDSSPDDAAAIDLRP